jgi:hypothetical protein
VRQPCEESRFDGLSFARRQRYQCRAQPLALLAQLEHIARVGGDLGRLLHIANLAALLPAFEAQAVDCPRARLVHDPAEHSAVRGVVTRRAPPHVMEDVDCQLLGGFPVGRDAERYGEDHTMRSLVKRMQRELVARGN